MGVNRGILDTGATGKQRRKNIANRRYGRLFVESFSHVANRQAFWNCLCDCGKRVVYPTRFFSVRGCRESCGCKHRENFLAAVTKHGMTGSPEYITWAAMIQRCTNPECSEWQRYGGRGIRVSERWLKFENFLSDMGLRPSPKHSIDRYPDNDGHYELANARWATMKQQARNKRSNHIVMIGGVKMCITDAAKKIGMNVGTMQYRLKRGIPLDKPLQPTGRE